MAQTRKSPARPRRAQHNRQIDKLLADNAPRLMDRAIRWALAGDVQTLRVLMPMIYKPPKHSLATISTPVDIRVGTLDEIRQSIERVAQAVGRQDLGLEEGDALTAMLSRIHDSMASAELDNVLKKLNEIEEGQKAGARIGATGPQSNLNGSTPRWGNFKH